MTLDIVGLHGPNIRALAALEELQGLKVNIGAGVAAATNFTVSGIRAVDTLLSVWRFDRDAVASNIDIDDVTGEASITSSNNIQLSTTDSTGDTLVVFWYDKTAGD